MGGTSAVSAAVESAIDALDSGQVNVVRVAGADRQGTAVELARRILGPDTLGSYGIPLAAGGSAFLVARPDQFPDALAAAPLAGSTASPLFLAASTQGFGATSTDGVVNYPNSALFTRAILLGGTLALSPQVGTEAGNAVALQPSS